MSATVKPTFWAVVFAMLKAARRRGTARFRRQFQFRKLRGRRTAALAPSLGFFLVTLFFAVPHLGAALFMSSLVAGAERAEAELKGRVVVEEWFAGQTEQQLDEIARHPGSETKFADERQTAIETEAPRLARRYGGDEQAISDKLAETLSERPKAFIAETSLWWQPGRLPDAIALLVLIWWGLALACQGEGLDLDTQRPRNPLWEWLFSHPAQPAAIFFAEMLAPISANPAYLAAPVFPGFLFGLSYGWPVGVAAALLIGVPVAIAFACLGKAFEIAVTLRLSPRTRGAALAVLGWFGYFSFFLFMILAQPLHPLLQSVLNRIAFIGEWPLPMTRGLLGFTADGNYLLWRGFAFSLLAAALVAAGAVGVSVASARSGLEAPPAPALARRGNRRRALFLRNPLYRKELLWFWRDRGALVQGLLVPFSFSLLQLFNLRGLIAGAREGWSSNGGVAILFGTYFLLTLGPRSLAAEGQALWIALTWPRGLEALLKAKARLWTQMATAPVAVILLYTLWRHPEDFAGVLFVTALWLIFARATAEKMVTVPTVKSGSGEPERAPAGLRWAASLGIFTFAIGVLTQQFGLAIAGVVYAIITAAAMWQDFRFRLPYLYDPWSQKPPQAPTLLHAIVAISAMVEGVALLSAGALWTFGKAGVIEIDTAIYGACAGLVTAFLIRFLGRRDVSLRDLIFWGPQSRAGAAGSIALGIVAGLALGALAHGYLWALRQWPDLAQMLGAGGVQSSSAIGERIAFAILAIGLAPFAEEFLFRGLLYRALDREWGAGRAALGSAALFAVYHPIASWPPVAVLGLLNATLFRRTGNLGSSIAAHIAYNTIILLL